METAYIGTTIISYLVASPSRDAILAAHQQLTRHVRASSNDLLGRR